MEARLFLHLLLIVAIEYGLKALFEGAAARVQDSRSARIYIAYRLTTLLCYTALVAGFSSLGLGLALIAGALLSVVGSLELLASALSGWAYLRTQRLCRPLHILAHGFFAAATLYAGLAIPWHQTLPTYLTHLPRLYFTSEEMLETLRWVFVYVMASVPSNYIIRWLMNKESDPSLPELAVGDLLLSLPLTTPRTASSWPIPSATAEERQVETYRAGRIIGVLERWMMLALLARGEPAAVGLVFTAKSIVRYREFEKQEFAEYYLVGTLYSILIALALSPLL